MNVNIKEINEYMKLHFNSEIMACSMCIDVIYEDTTDVYIAVKLQNGVLKQIEYQYLTDNPDEYGYNVDEFDPFIFNKYFLFF